MKKLISTTIKLTSAIVIISTLSLTLYIQHQASTYDPIKSIIDLKDQHRRDEAFDLASFFKESQPDNPEFGRLEKELDYSVLEKLKSAIWNGMIKGEVFDTPSGLGAISADLTLFGDLRDLVIQGWKFITGDPDLDKTTALLSGAGVALTFMPCIDGCGALIKNSIKYKGVKKGVALEGSFSSFEYLLTGLARLQVGFDKKMIEGGILMLTAARSEKSSLGTSRDLAVAEVEQLYPTISMPVSIALFDLGVPVISNGDDEGGDEDGISIPAAEGNKAQEADQKA